MLIECKACGRPMKIKDHELCAECYYESERALMGYINDVQLGCVLHNIPNGHPHLERKGLILAPGCYRTYTPNDGTDEDYDV